MRIIQIYYEDYVYLYTYYEDWRYLVSPDAIYNHEANGQYNPFSPLPSGSIVVADFSRVNWRRQLRIYRYLQGSCWVQHGVRDITYVRNERLDRQDGNEKEGEAKEL